MKANASNCNGSARVVRIHMQPQDEERPTPVEIKIVGNGGTGDVILPALLSERGAGKRPVKRLRPRRDDLHPSTQNH